MATISTADLTAFEERYSRWLDYSVRERGTISSALAHSWGAPKVAGRDYVLMSSVGNPDVFLRAVEGPGAKDFMPMTTWGWNAIEIVADNSRALRQKFLGSPFNVVGEPQGLNSYPSIVAFQAVGSDQELIYLTAETGDRDQSPLPLPDGDVGRIFIMVVAGPDIEALLGWYTDKFHLRPGPARQVPIRVVQEAQGLAPDELVDIGLSPLTEHGNLIEFDGYSTEHAGPRPITAGELPPGVSISSFSVADLDALELRFLSPPANYPGYAYAKGRAATAVGPAGELIELIEDGR
ncbi:MAG: hypothetical protein AB8B96_21110 [Lysobacterales bacterium]